MRIVGAEGAAGSAAEPIVEVTVAAQPERVRGRRARRARRQLQRSVQAVIAGLGESEREVAASLAAYGVKGACRDRRGCAIARYLQALLGGESAVDDLAVGGNRVTITCYGRRKPIVVPLPESARSFVRSFDAGRYPQLVANRP